jgi:hypothetical protein
MLATRTGALSGAGVPHADDALGAARRDGVAKGVCSESID